MDDKKHKEIKLEKEVSNSHSGKEKQEDRILIEIRGLWRQKKEGKISEKTYNDKVAKLRVIFEKENKDKLAIFDRYKKEIENTRSESRLSHKDLKSQVFKQVSETKFEYFKKEISRIRESKSTYEKEIKKGNLISKLVKTEQKNYQKGLETDLSIVAGQISKFRLFLNQNKNDPQYAEHEKEFKKYTSEFRELLNAKDLKGLDLKDSISNSWNDFNIKESGKIVLSYSLGAAKGALKGAVALIDPRTYINLSKGLAHVVTEVYKISREGGIDMLQEEIANLTNRAGEVLVQKINEFKDLPPDEMGEAIGNIVGETIVAIYGGAGILKGGKKLGKLGKNFKGVGKGFKKLEKLGMDTEIVQAVQQGRKLKFGKNKLKKIGKFEEVVADANKGLKAATEKTKGIKRLGKAKKPSPKALDTLEEMASKSKSGGKVNLASEAKTVEKGLLKATSEGVEIASTEAMSGVSKVAEGVKAVVKESKLALTDAKGNRIFTKGEIRGGVIMSATAIAGRNSTTEKDQNSSKGSKNEKDKIDENSEASSSKLSEGLKDLSREYDSYANLKKILDVPGQKNSDIVIDSRNNLRANIFSDGSGRYSISFGGANSLSHTSMTWEELINTISFAKYSNKMGLAFLIPHSGRLMQKLNKVGGEINDTDGMTTKEKNIMLSKIGAVLLGNANPESNLEEREKRFKNISAYSGEIKKALPNLKSHIGDFESIEELARARFPKNGAKDIDFDKLIDAIA